MYIRVCNAAGHHGGLYPACAVVTLHILLIFVAEFYGPDSPGGNLKSRPQSYLVRPSLPVAGPRGRKFSRATCSAMGGFHSL